MKWDLTSNRYLYCGHRLPGRVDPDGRGDGPAGGVPSNRVEGAIASITRHVIHANKEINAGRRLSIWFRAALRTDIQTIDRLLPAAPEKDRSRLNAVKSAVRSVLRRAPAMIPSWFLVGERSLETRGASGERYECNVVANVLGWKHPDLFYDGKPLPIMSNQPPPEFEHPPSEYTFIQLRKAWFGKLEYGKKPGKACSEATDEDIIGCLQCRVMKEARTRKLERWNELDNCRTEMQFTLEACCLSGYKAFWWWETPTEEEAWMYLIDASRPDVGLDQELIRELDDQFCYYEDSWTIVDRYIRGRPPGLMGAR
jgi:hypothetical protein